MVEHRAAGIPRYVGGHRWRHTSPHVQVGRDGSARICHLLYCTYVQYTSKMFGWGEEGNKRYAPRCLRGSGSKIPFEIPIHAIRAIAALLELGRVPAVRLDARATRR